MSEREWLEGLREEDQEEWMADDVQDGPDPNIDLVGEVDAQKWARRFVEIFDPVIWRREDGRVFQGDDAEHLMLTWFANAIESGGMHARRTS